MVEPRLKTGLQVSALLRQANAAGQPGVVVRKGDPDAGTILLQLHGRTGIAAFTQGRDLEGNPGWVRLGNGVLDAQTLEDLIARHIRRDPDLWIVEIEAPDLKPGFEMKVI